MTRREKLLVVHGHFYQPPREDPWTGRIERQESAGEDHDWNVRIARECYAPNAGNYEFMSFNFGPTLLSWLESAAPQAYRALAAADAASAARLDGHGNALAQAYSHMILPLANDRDLQTQIVWGLADFRRRFGREAEALWLPETAADGRVLSKLAEHGMRYVLLAPGQAARVRPRGEAEWTDVSAGSVPTGRFYRWTDGERELAVFFYDGDLSHGVSFGDFTADAKTAAETLEARALTVLCNDGETYGHHKKFADLFLDHLFREELPRRGIRPVNLGYALSRLGEPRWDVELKTGPQRLGTAWSCAHGVGRWMEDCGCGTEPGGGKWRAPLREALDWLRDELARLTEREGARLFKDVWAARNAYVEVLLDPEAQEAFFDAQAKKRLSDKEREKGLALMELQKLAMYMFTSCGWFFAAVDGLEAEQNLKYAAKAVELAKGFGVDLEAELVSRLKPAGADAVYAKARRPSWR